MKRMRRGILVLALGLAAAGPARGGDSDDVRAAFDLRMDGKAKAALAMLDEEVAARPENARTWFELSRTRLYMMDISGSMEAIDRAVELEPSAAYHHFAGMVAALAVIDAAHHDDRDRMKELGVKSFHELEAAVAADPDGHAARYRLAQLTRDLAPELGLDISGQEEHIRFLEEKDPIWGAKGRSLLLEEGPQRKLWEEILAEHDGEARAWSEAGEAFIDLGDLKRAEECIARAMSLDPDRSYSLLRLGTAYLMAEDLSKAAHITERYLNGSPPVPLRAWALARLGQIRQRMGNSAEGKKMMDQALALDESLWRGFMPPGEDLFTAP